MAIFQSSVLKKYLKQLNEMEWMELFETKKKEALELKGEIDALYGLTEVEIKIVENS